MEWAKSVSFWLECPSLADELVVGEPLPAEGDYDGLFVRRQDRGGGLLRTGRQIGDQRPLLPLGDRLLIDPVAPCERPQALLTMLYRSTDRLVCLSCSQERDRRG